MYTYKAIVDRVIDGDSYEMTISVGFDVWVKTKFRLRGVDTPETHRPKSEKEKAHGERATAAVKLLIEGKEVTVKSYKTGKYGRYICDVLTEDDVDLATFLIENDLLKREVY